MAGVPSLGMILSEGGGRGREHSGSELAASLDGTKAGRFWRFSRRKTNIFAELLAITPQK